MLILTAEENSGTTIRSATVTITCNSLSTTVTIDQLPETIPISNNGGSVSQTLLNPFAISAVNAYWATIGTVGNTVTFSANANTGDTTRYETVRFTVDNTFATTQLVQAGGGGSLTVSPSAIVAEYTGGDKIMTVNSTGNWSATSKPDWVSLSQETGPSGQSTVILTFTENTGNTVRSGNLVITDGTRSATVNLAQRYHIVESYLTAAPSAITYDYVGGNKYININSSAEWSAVSKPDWITLSMESGASGNSILGVDASINISMESGRSGDVVLSNGTNTLTIPVNQAQKVVQRRINVTPNSLYFDFTGNTKYITVSSEDNNWSLFSKPDWIILSQNTGETGYSLVSVTAPANTGDTTKTGEMIFTDGNFTVSVSVAQPASSSTKTLTVSPSVVYVDNTGGTPIVHIAYGNRNGDDVTITSSADWVHPTYVQWTGDTGNLVLNVDNYGVDFEREATITVASILDPTLTATFTIKQNSKPYIMLYPSFIEFEQTGGTAEITLGANVNWLIDIIDTTDD